MVEEDEKYTYIATQLCDCTVKEWLEKKEVTELNEKDWSKQAAGFVQDMLSGLAYMHSKGIVHKDLKVQIGSFLLLYIIIYVYCMWWWVGGCVRGWV